jgi:hypothetical protein
MRELIKEILKEETQDDNKDNIRDINRVARILGLVPVSKHVCGFTISISDDNSMIIMKWIPSFYHNGNTDVMENIKLKKLVESNINVKNFSWFYITSAKYDYNDQTCDHIKELTKKLSDDHKWVNPNNQK